MIIFHRVINTSRLLSNVLVSDILLNLETEKILICDVICVRIFILFIIMSRGREGYSVSSLRAFSYSISRGRIANLSSFSTRTHTTQKNNYISYLVAVFFLDRNFFWFPFHQTFFGEFCLFLF